MAVFLLPFTRSLITSVDLSDLLLLGINSVILFYSVLIFKKFFQILDVVRTGVDKGPTAGYEAEAQGFGELAVTPQSRGLIGLFRGQTECKKNRFGKSKVDIKSVSTKLPYLSHYIDCKYLASFYHFAFCFPKLHQGCYR